MAQGALKVKGGKKPDIKKRNNKSGGAVKKKPPQGRNVIAAPKNQRAVQVAKLNKTIRKGINESIEAQLKQRAVQYEEGKKFSILAQPKKAGGSSKKNKQQKKK